MTEKNARSALVQTANTSNARFPRDDPEKFPETFSSQSGEEGKKHIMKNIPFYKAIKPGIRSAHSDKMRPCAGGGCVGRDRGEPEPPKTVSRDRFHGASVLVDSATIYGMLGDADRAVPLIEHALAIPSSMQWLALRLDPKWDSIRSDPRFQQLVAEPPAGN